MQVVKGYKKMGETENLPRWISVQKAAEIAAAHEKTIRRWVSEGRLEATRPIESGSSRIRIRTSSLLQMLGER